MIEFGREFEELARSEKKCQILEVGCGTGALMVCFWF
jgi:cyclopropane fatty-acyl-phospholipid synthase-like methyltransferase